MNPVSKQPVAATDELELAVDALIAAQKEEQELIINRQADKLPAACEKIDKLSQQLESLQVRYGYSGPVAKRQKIPAGSRLATKLRQLQDIAYQNHLLLDNSLHFLQEIFREVMGLNVAPPVYKNNGNKPTPSFGASGMLLNMQL